MTIVDDYDGQMIFGDLGGLKLPDICLTGEEKPKKKNLTQETCRTRARCMTGTHAAAWPTAVQMTIIDYESMRVMFVFPDTKKFIKISYKVWCDF